jgi:hypothetical protein
MVVHLPPELIRARRRHYTPAAHSQEVEMCRPTDYPPYEPEA